MPTEIVVPRLGWSMDEGTFGEWLKSDGEHINAGEMLFVLEGEKASQEIESFDSGTLHIPPDAPKPGDKVAVGQLLGYLLATGESPPLRGNAPAAAQPTSTSRGGSAAARVAGPAARRRARELGVDLNSVPTADPTGRVRAVDLRVAEAAIPTTSTSPGQYRSRNSFRVWRPRVSSSTINARSGSIKMNEQLRGRRKISQRQGEDRCRQEAGTLLR